MARKLRIHIDPGQPGLFDDLETVIHRHDPLTKDPEVPDVGIADFVVRTRKRQENEKGRYPLRENDRQQSGSTSARRHGEIFNNPDDRDTTAFTAVDPQMLTRADNIFFMSFGSGSSGNSSYLGDASGGLLIDAGVDSKTIIKELEDNGLSIDMVKGICLTHDHSDHVRFIYNLVRRRPDIPVYCTPKALNGILRRHSISRRLKDYHHPIYKEFPFKIGNFEITAFDVNHDGTDNCGFFITHGSQSFAIATDLGCITPRVDYYMRRANHIMIEANYDSAMLDLGTYPIYLKSRIRADYGHMDNAATARFLADIHSPLLKTVFLCHLSQDNNTPETAFTTVAASLSDAGVIVNDDNAVSLDTANDQIQLAVLPRYEPSRLFTFRSQPPHNNPLR